MIGAATAVGAAALLGPAITASTADAQTASESGGVAADPVLTPRVNGLHLQFGQNASSEVIVSWHSLLPVSHPRVMLGDPTGRVQGAGKTAVAGRTAVAGDGSHHRRPSPCGYSPVKRNSACQGSSMWTISQ
jgi:hypothetical protein